MKKIDNIQLEAVLQQLKKRKEAETAPLPFIFNDYAFDKQKEFFRGPGPRFRVACCGRRSGKTVGIAADGISTCLEEPSVKLLYITLSKESARKIIWSDLIEIIETHKIPTRTIDNHRLEIHFMNGSAFYIAGAKDSVEIEKFRGWKLRKAYIDECQSFRPYIKELINDIIIKALRDLRGPIYLTGTPAPTKSGFFYEMFTSGKWLASNWTAFDNPFMHNPPELDLHVTLQEEMELMGINDTDPSWRRETYGEWVDDEAALVFRYDVTKNDYTSLPSDMEYVMGVDIGYHDSDAICIIGYSKNSDACYLVDEQVNAKEDISSLVARIEEFREIYNPHKIVMDTGGLGKKIQEELIKRYKIPVKSAEKNRKFEFIELLNADLRRGKFKARPNSQFAEDCMLVQWDKRNPARLKISDSYHSDIHDSVIYAWREANHYIFTKPKEPKATYESNPDKYMDELEDKLAYRAKLEAEDPDMAEYQAYIDEINDESDGWF